MDDITVLSARKDKTKVVLTQLEEAMKGARMMFKPKKCRSLSLRKGVLKYVPFSIEGAVMPNVSEEPVKSLGRWYSGALTDRGRGMQCQQQVMDGLEAIEKSQLAGKFKAWCVQFGLIPRVLWALTIYDVGITRVQVMEKMISARLRKWLGFPRMLATQSACTR